jgi:hypothetical protein
MVVSPTLPGAKPITALPSNAILHPGIPEPGEKKKNRHRQKPGAKNGESPPPKQLLCISCAGDQAPLAEDFFYEKIP